MTDVSKPCPFMAGSPEKAEWLVLRAEQGLPLWIDGDCSDVCLPRGEDETTWKRMLAISNRSLMQEVSTRFGDTFSVGKRRRRKELLDEDGAYSS